jgi:hypothetical protein
LISILLRSVVFVELLPFPLPFALTMMDEWIEM